MTTVIVGVLVVFGSVLLALAGLVLVHLLVPTPHREPSNFVAGLIYMPIGGLYGILMCFAAFLVWQQFNTGHTTTERQASALAAIYWPLMGEGQESSHAWDIVDELRRSIDGFEPSTPTEQTLHTQEVTLIDDMMNDRRLRLLQSREGMPPSRWVILVSGIVVLVGFSYFYGMKNFRVRMVIES